MNREQHHQWQGLIASLWIMTIMNYSLTTLICKAQPQNANSNIMHCYAQELTRDFSATYL
jgi:hypothetical protein